MRTWRRRKQNLGVFSTYAKRYKSVYISVNNNTNLNLFKILSNYIIQDRLSQKTISRYCPFKHISSIFPHFLLVTMEFRGFLFSPLAVVSYWLYFLLLQTKKGEYQRQLYIYASGYIKKALKCPMKHYLYILLGPPGCAQASPYLSPGLLDFLVV